MEQRNASQNDHKAASNSQQFRSPTPQQIETSLRGQLRNRRAVNPNAKINEFEVAEELGVSVGTVRRWRLFGRGPRFVKVGGTAVRYSRADVETWLAAQPTGGGLS